MTAERITFITPVAPYHRDKIDKVRSEVTKQSIPCRHLVIVDEQQRGAGWARNQALARVDTEFVVFLDADDEISPLFAEATLAEYERVGRSRYIYTDWIENGRIAHAPDCAWVDKTFHCITTLLPTAWARAVGGFDESLPGGEDTAFYVALCVRGMCGHRLNSPLFVYGAGGQRSKAFVADPNFSAYMQYIDRFYGGIMACCSDHKPLPQGPDYEPQDGDILAVALWGGNRGEFGRATGRRYPRSGNGALMWIAPADVAASPNLWSAYEQPAQAAPLPQSDVLRGIGNALFPQPERVIDAAFVAQHTAPKTPDLAPILKARKPAKLRVEFPSGQIIHGWNLDAHTLDIALRHAPKSGAAVTAGVGTIGFYCVELAQLGYKTYAIEPNPQPELFAAIDGTDVTFWHMALGAVSEEVSFYIGDDPNTSSTRQTHWGVNNAREIRVQAISYMDAVKRIGETPAIVQVDIEGNEVDVLPTITDAPPPVLIYEYGGGDLAKTRSANWQPAYVARASAMFEALRPHYTAGAVIDPVKQGVFEFKVADVPEGGYAGLITYPEAAFGNIVLWR